MFSVTPKAVDEIKRLLAEDDIENAFLRVRIVPGGCSGFSYEMGFDDETDEGDNMIESGGIKVAIEEISYTYLDGSVLDFKDGLRYRKSERNRFLRLRTVFHRVKKAEIRNIQTFPHKTFAESRSDSSRAGFIERGQAGKTGFLARGAAHRQQVTNSRENRFLFA